MKAFRWCAGLLIGLLLAPVSAAWAEPTEPERPDPAVLQAREFCLDRRIVIANIVIDGGRCYNLYLARTADGSFLAFGRGGTPLVGFGQSAPIASPGLVAGAVPFQYLVRLPALITHIPNGWLQSIAVQVLRERSRGTILIPWPGNRRVEVRFEER